MKMESLLILGRQPALGLAELESLYGSAAVRAIGEQAAIVSVDPCLLAFDRLGGSLKFCKILTTLETSNWGDVEKFLLKVSPEHSKTMPEGKMLLGLSLYGFNETVQRITATGLSLKKAIRKTGRSVRFIPNQAAELNSAQVIHNQLTGQNGWELVFIRANNKIVIGQTIKVQDIASYSRRDRERPNRDARVGMLPPKLAQIIINLAVGHLPETALQSICEIPADQPIPLPILNQKILDPFCGTGVILQEATLMGYGVSGTDIEQRMVDYSVANANWLIAQYPVSSTPAHIEKADATSYTWPQQFDFIASETYLGRPFTTTPSPEIVKQTMADCQLIIKKFLQNIAHQIKPGTRLCLAVPAWQIKQNHFQHLPLIDQLTDLGYTRISFEHVRSDQLIYYRSDQIVARELLVITSM
jgi:tRNA G10  N-methylase Trm11